MSNETKAILYKDENVVRLVALQVTLLATIVFLFEWKLPALVLVIDFAIRAFTKQPSPLAFTAQLLVSIFNAKPKLIFAAPKKFAALLGFILSAGIFALLFSNQEKAVTILAGLLFLCAFLEAALNICLGCYIYNYILLPFQRKNKANENIEFSEQNGG